MKTTLTFTYDTGLHVESGHRASGAEGGHAPSGGIQRRPLRSTWSHAGAGRGDEARGRRCWSRTAARLAGSLLLQQSFL